MMLFLLVCAGGALGSGARYLISGWMQTLTGIAFPAGTLTVNLLGSFGLAFAMVAGTRSAALPPGARVFLTTGVFGGFTTYSTFNYETIEMLRTGATVPATMNLVIMLASCLAGGWAGIVAARTLLG